MKMLCDRVKELESFEEEFKAELGASATVHERLRILEKEIFEDAGAYEDAITRHKESEIPVKENLLKDLLKLSLILIPTNQELETSLI